MDWFGAKALTVGSPTAFWVAGVFELAKAGAVAFVGLPFPDEVHVGCPAGADGEAEGLLADDPGRLVGRERSMNLCNCNRSAIAIGRAERR